MKTKISPYVIAIAILTILTFFVMPLSQETYAKNVDLTKGKEGRAEIAVLRNLHTNEKIYLPVRIDKGNDANSVNYEVFVPSSILSYESHQHSDITGGVTLTITQNYTEKFSPEYAVSVSSSSAKWTKSDNTISITNASVTSFVSGYISGGGYLTKNETRSIGIPSLNYVYYQYPSWAGTYIIIDEISYQASRADSTLVRGGSSWSLGFCVAQGGQQSLACE